jgi:SecD/SecF fusion protein
MKNRGLVFFLTIAVSISCFYYLSFTWLDYGIQQQATKHAMDETGNINFATKQAYLDSIWKEPVFKILGVQYTYEEVKENALSLGLDLQGGMHVTLEVSPIELIKNLANNSKDEAFLAALESAEQKQQAQVALPFTKLFYQAYKQLKPENRLSTLFATVANRNRIGLDADDQEVLKFLDTEVDHAIHRAFEIIRSRIDRFGTSQPNIQRIPGTGKIQIELPGANNPERVRKLLQGVAQLRFCQVYELKELNQALQAVNSLLVLEEKSQASIQQKSKRNIDDQDLAKQLEGDLQAESTNYGASSLLLNLLKPGPAVGLTYGVKDVPTIQQILARHDVKALLPHDLQWLWEIKSRKIDNGNQEVLTLYPIKLLHGSKALLEGEVITDARQSFDEKGMPSVTMQMHTAGAKAWKKITAQNIGKNIAITLDNRVYSAPQVHAEIPNGNSQISGNFTIEEAKDLANILKAGSLPAPVKIVEEALIGPTLSKQAQSQGMVSMLLGLSLVVLFMFLYYAKSGAIANLALLFNILFILGILAQLGTSLTLAGIAGIVLTIGMSIDANVLIFERIREELRKGAKIRDAINLGYQKAYSSILDSNVTTFLTGAILYGLGQGPVRGFAATLMLGILTSFFTAVFITRLIFSWLAKRQQLDRLSFSLGYNRNLLTQVNFDFLGNRRVFYAISASIIAIGVLLTIKQGGLNLGIDFTGGRSYIVAFNQPIDPIKLKNKLASSLGDQGAEVKAYGGNNVMKVTTGYLSQAEDVDTDEKIKNILIKNVESLTGLSYTDAANALGSGGFTIASAAKVGPSIAGDIQKAAKKSVLFSLAIIFGYILIRFRQWQFGLAAVLALLHDTLVVFAAFAIARAFGYVYEVDQIFVAAILTIIGYSINDTVVVFDRIRERRKAIADSNFVKIANQSINETLSRTLITSLTTLFVVFILFVWGGEALRGFSFALLIGIVFGTYSSICIATPLVVAFSKTYRKI